MADAFDWKSLIAPALATLLPFLPRLWPDNLRRLQSEAETRVKRLEALEKALSVATTAKTTLGTLLRPPELRTAGAAQGPALPSMEANGGYGSGPDTCLPRSRT
jgi:hypothetical protein